LVLDRDEPIARIERVDPATITEDRMARLEKAGLARRARRPFQPEFLDEAPATAKQSVLDALLEERRDGR